MTQATFYGIGVGPGDPELLTLKAARLIAQVDVVAYPSTTWKESTARSIAQAHIQSNQTEYPIPLPMRADRTETEAIYTQAAHDIDHYLTQGRHVAFLCLGDPMLYGSFVYLYRRLHHQHPISIVPGINSFSAASAVSKIPLATLEQSLSLVAGSTPDPSLVDALNQHDTVIILKAGRHRHHIASLIGQAGRVQEAAYIEHASKPEQQIYHDITQLPDGPGTYFSLFLVARQS